MLLAHGLVIPAPLRVVADCNGGCESIVKAISFQTVGCPVSGVVKVLAVMAAGHSNIVREENTSSNVLITVDGISSKEGFDFVRLSIVSLDVD